MNRAIPLLIPAAIVADRSAFDAVHTSVAMAANGGAGPADESHGLLGTLLPK